MKELTEIQETLDSEPKLHKWILKTLEEDFYTKERVWGEHIITKDRVQADIIIFPKKHLVDMGFIEEHIVIEVKHINNSLSKKGSQSFYQAITYKNSVFKIKNKDIRPAFCLLFSELSFEDNFKNINNKNHIDLTSKWSGYIALASHFLVGTIKIKEVGFIEKLLKKDKVIDMIFDSKTYFRKSLVDGGIKIKNQSLIKRKNAGNIQNGRKAHKN